MVYEIDRCADTHSHAHSHPSGACVRVRVCFDAPALPSYVRFPKSEGVFVCSSQFHFC